MNPLLTANLKADCELKLALIREKLAAAQPHLAEAINLIHHHNLASSYSQIYSDCADAYFYCKEAIDKINDRPQPDELYDVAGEHLSPITGKAQPPESAF